MTKKTQAYLNNDRLFGQLVRFWRSVHKVTQEDLAFEIDSSARHINRLEKGKARPTENMIHRIAGYFQLRQRDLNNMLLAAGYASMRVEKDMRAPENQQRLSEIVRMLRALDPYPTVVMNVVGERLLMNKAWLGLEQAHAQIKNPSDSNNVIDFLMGLGEIQSGNGLWTHSLGVILLSIQQLVLYYDAKSLDTDLEKLLSSEYLPEDWKLQAAQTISGQQWNVNFLVEGQPATFFSHSGTVSMSGPLSFRPVPEMIFLTFYPEVEDLDLTAFVNHTLKHDLLLY